METGHWIAIGVPGAGLLGGAAVKVFGLFGRVRELERLNTKNAEDHQRNDDDHDKLHVKVDTALMALRELLIHEGLRKPGQGINGEEAVGG